MIHQPSSGTYGTVTDMKIDLEESVAMKEEFINVINKHCEHDLSDLIERDKWLSPSAAKELGLIDNVK
jgi:ATP-dependent protease ClpP protease subunit